MLPPTACDGFRERRSLSTGGVALLLRSNARVGPSPGEERGSPPSAGSSSRLRAAARGLGRELIGGPAHGLGRLTLGLLEGVPKVVGSAGCCERGGSSTRERDPLRLNPRLKSDLPGSTAAGAGGGAPPIDLLLILPDAVLLRLFAPHPEARGDAPGPDLVLRAEPGVRLRRWSILRRGMGVIRPMTSCRLMFWR